MTGIRGAINTIAVIAVAGTTTALVFFLQNANRSQEHALLIDAVQQGVNHASAQQIPVQSVQMPEGELGLAEVSPALEAQVRADDTVQIAINADVETLNDLICQHANQIFGHLQNEAIVQGKDVESMALDLLRQKNTITQSQAEMGGYNGTSESTGIGAAHLARKIAIKFVIQDIQNSRASGSEMVKVRFCTAPLWEGLASNSDAIREVSRSRAANRSEAIRALQRAEVASDVGE